MNIQLSPFVHGRPPTIDEKAAAVLARLREEQHWKKYETPSCHRIPSRAECAANFREACALRYLQQAG